MIRRRTAPIVALTAALALTVARPSPAPAAGMATFRLTNIDPAGSQPVTSVLARILPPSTVVAPDLGSDPATILPESSGYQSTGFDEDALEFGLVDGVTSDGEGFQILKLDFGQERGFEAGGRLYFQLQKAPEFDGRVRLVLPESITNLAIEMLEDLTPPPTDGDGGGTQTPTPQTPGGGETQVPEPASVLVWLGVVSLGLLRARAYRRSHALATA